MSEHEDLQAPKRPTGAPRRSLEDTQPNRALSEDDLETGELPGELGEPTIARSRVPTGMTPTARLPRAVPPPRRAVYKAPHPPQPPGGAETSSGAGSPWRRGGRLAVSSCFAVVAVIVLIFFLAFAGSVVGYVYIANQLPSPGELQSRQTAFVSSKIYDKDGNLLYEVTDPQGGRRTYVPLAEISQHLINATIATEDRDFWLHPGFDPIAIARAIYYNLSEKRIVSGASTITQQLARNVLLSPEERVQDTAWRKIKEIVLAAELTRTYPKETILEIYLNELYYGNLAYGIQAASETYFGVDAQDLTLAQASFLAGLPQAPATYDPFGGGYDAALGRHQDVLSLMVEAGYINNTESALAAVEIQNYAFQAPRVDIATAPHFVVYVRQALEATYGPEALYRGTGLRIYTTLDPRLQALAEQSVREGVAALAERNATNGALVAIEPASGYIRALVGSADFENEAIDGQVNVALRCRQPGSSIKPLTYIASFERDWTPATLFWDVRTEFPDGANPPYVPTNYDEKFHGPMLMRDALANSYNVPAVDALQFVGVEGLLEMASRLGVASLAHPEEHCPDYPYEQPPTYGLALTLGGGEVKLLEMTGAFATFANQGLRMPPTPILRIEDSRGEVLVDNTERQGEQAISAAHAYLMTHILSDTRARCQTFSCPSVLELDRPVAAKTGTTNDYRDAWTVGYTPDLATGVWVGNSDNAEMIRLPGSAGAGPIWHNFMAGAHQGLPVRDFQRPPDVVELEICADSGARPTEHCPRRKKEVFAKDQPPLDEGHDWYQKVQIDAHTGLLANEFCPDNVTEQVMIVIEDERGREWAQAHPEHFGGVPLAPRDACTESTVRPEVRITQPQSGSAVQGVVSIVGTAQMPDFSHYEVRYSGSAGSGWISGPHLTPVRDGVLTQWDVTNLPAGSYTIHVVAYDRENRQVEGRAQVNVAGPTKTPTPQPSLTPTWTRTVVAPTATWTPQPQPSATPTWTPTWTPPPAASPTATPSATPTTAITNTQPVTTTANQAATPTATREP